MIDQQIETRDAVVHPPEVAEDGMTRSQRRALERGTAVELRRAEVELERVREINAIAGQYARHVTPELVAEAIRSGQTVEKFQATIAERMTESKVTPSELRPAASFGNSDGVSPERREWTTLVRGFSLGRSLLADIDSASDLRSAGREAEGSRELSRQSPLPTSGRIVPLEAVFGGFVRGLNAGTSTLGGNTIATFIDASLFADVLRNRTVAGALGARTLPGLTSNLSIPKKTAAASAAWLTELGTATAANPTLATVTLSPKRIGSYVDVSKQLMIQSELALENVVRDDLATTVLVELDRVALRGSGTSNEPTGIASTAGIGSVVGGTNGGTVAWSHIVDLEKVVANSNGIVNMASAGYAINSASRGLLKRTLKIPGVGSDIVMGDDLIDANGLTRLNGFRCGITNQPPSNLTKGTATTVCSQLIFGDWSELFIGQFGPGVEIVVDPYTLAREGQVRINCNLFADTAVRQAASFAVMSDALTA